MKIEAHDEKIICLFDEARSQLEKIENNSKQQKKQAIKDLAKSLEGKIPNNSIYIEITNQLRGRVSESFVRPCLDDKYKQSYRVQNANKQNKKQTHDDSKDEVEKLASVASLNQELAENQTILVGANGKALVQTVDADNDESLWNI